MKKLILLLFTVLLMPSAAFAVSSNGNGSANSANQSSAVANGSDDTDSVTTSQLTEKEAKVEEEVKKGKPEYSPRNARATERMSAVATAVEQLIRASDRIEDKGIGDQIRVIAQAQSKNQDKINQSIDKAENRSSFAKFFIGANFKELKDAKKLMIENQKQITDLKNIMATVESETDKLVVANQIIALQEENTALQNQLDAADDGFSLFGWFSKIITKY